MTTHGLSDKITIYLPDDVAKELEAIRATRRPIPSMNAMINEILFDGLPSASQNMLRRMRRTQTGGSAR